MNTGWTTIEKIKGTPITLRVPTHLKVYVYERHYLQRVIVGGIETIEPVKMCVPVRDFATELIRTEKIMMVDFKRPAAGTFNLDVEFTEDQYFQRVSQDVTDETIQRVTELVGQLGSLGFNQASGPGDSSIEANLKEITSVAAVGIFEIDAPDFEQQVMAFLDCHINNAHDALVTPPWVENIHRANIVGNPNPASSLCPGPGCPLGVVQPPTYAVPIAPAPAAPQNEPF